MTSSGQTIEMSVVTRILDSDWSVPAIPASHWSIMTHDRYSAFLADTLHTNLRRDKIVFNLWLFVMINI